MRVERILGGPATLAAVCGVAFAGTEKGRHREGEYAYHKERQERDEGKKLGRDVQRGHTPGSGFGKIHTGRPSFQTTTLLPRLA